VLTSTRGGLSSCLRALEWSICCTSGEYGVLLIEFE
jgi:hypothetical protein